MSSKLPEVGEFWEIHGYRRKVAMKSNSKCVMQSWDGDLSIQPVQVVVDNWTHLPWCKSFDDAEPKPVTETVEFREYICGQEIKWLSWVPADAIPTGLVRQVKVTR